MPSPRCIIQNEAPWGRQAITAAGAGRREDETTTVEAREASNHSPLLALAGRLVVGLAIGVLLMSRPSLAQAQSVPLESATEVKSINVKVVQYISVPGYPWQRLRREFPAQYETYVDLEPGVWTKVRIEVRGDKARLYVHDAPQPTLLIDDLKQGQRDGAIALWVGPGTIAHFSNLRILP
jgi:hypothetical protein